MSHNTTSKELKSIDIIDSSESIQEINNDILKIYEKINKDYSDHIKFDTIKINPDQSNTEKIETQLTNIAKATDIFTESVIFKQVIDEFYKHISKIKEIISSKDQNGFFGILLWNISDIVIKHIDTKQLLGDKSTQIKDKSTQQILIRYLSYIYIHRYIINTLLPSLEKGVTSKDNMYIYVFMEKFSNYIKELVSSKIPGNHEYNNIIIGKVMLFMKTAATKIKRYVLPSAALLFGFSLPSVETYSTKIAGVLTHPVVFAIGSSSILVDVGLTFGIVILSSVLVQVAIQRSVKSNTAILDKTNKYTKQYIEVETKIKEFNQLTEKLVKNYKKLVQIHNSKTRSKSRSKYQSQSQSRSRSRSRSRSNPRSPMSIPMPIQLDKPRLFLDKSLSPFSVMV